MMRTRFLGEPPFFRREVALILGLLLGSAPAMYPQQHAAHAPNAITGVYSVHTGRPLADILMQLQQAFISPIDYEEVAYESPTELKSKKIVTIYGPTTLLFTPITDFSVTLTEEKATPYITVQSSFSQYKNAGLCGASSYQVIQRSSRVDVIPYQVLGSNGFWHQTIPVMGHVITFPKVERSVEDTLNLVS